MKFIGTFIINLDAKFQVSSSSGSLIIAIKLTAKHKDISQAHLLFQIKNINNFLRPTVFARV
jgi:hypothetical protein